MNNIANKNEIFLRIAREIGYTLSLIEKENAKRLKKDGKNLPGYEYLQDLLKRLDYAAFNGAMTYKEFRDTEDIENLYGIKGINESDLEDDKVKKIIKKVKIKKLREKHSRLHLVIGDNEYSYQQEGREWKLLSYSKNKTGENL